MDYIWIILAFISAAIGLVGTIVPAIPGSVISYAALWLMRLHDTQLVSTTTLWVMGVLMVIVTVLDFVAPMWFAKIGGSSKRSMWGATIGLIVGLFFAPIGLIVGPFLGALIGELTTNAPFSQALNVATLSFLAFFLTTGIKIIYGLAAIVLLILPLFP